MSDIINILSLQNPWQRTGTLEIGDFVERDLYLKIKNLLHREEIFTLLGPRQVGKTTLFYKIISDALKNGFPKEDIYYFNLDNLTLRHFLNSFTDFFSFLTPKKNRLIYLFFDEAQRLKDAGIFLKQVKDLPGFRLKIFVSGSSSLLLRAKTKEYLTGRQIKFLLLPFSWEEFLKFKLIDMPKSNKTEELKEWFRIFGESTLTALNEFILYGGYPKIVKTESFEEKRLLLVNFVSDYLEKDISDFLRLDPILFNKILSMISYQIGNIVNMQELSRLTGASLPTVNKYLKILEETFVACRLPPFFSNKRKEFSHNPKIYFYDTGLRNILTSNFTGIDGRGDGGFLVENFLWSEFVKKQSDLKINYWCTRSHSEVDFILSKGQEVLPVEVKYQEMKKSEISVSFINFLKRYRPKQGLLFSKNYFGERLEDGIPVSYLPIVFPHYIPYSI